jgi:predicted DNA-binding transcriptional regulator AlpA
MHFPKSVLKNLRAKHVAQILNCSVSHIYTLVKMNKLTRIQIGPGAFIYDYNEVRRLAKNGI